MHSIEYFYFMNSKKEYVYKLIKIKLREPFTLTINPDKVVTYTHNIIATRIKKKRK